MNRTRLVLTGASAVMTIFAGSVLQAQAGNAGPAAATHAQAASQSDSASVVAVIERFHSALTAGDSVTAMSLLTPDVVILESGGVETRAEYQSHHLAGDIAYAKSMKRIRGPMRVFVRGDVAWASSTSTTTGESRGRQVNSAGAELMVLTRTSDGWRISAIHWSSRSQRPPA